MKFKINNSKTIFATLLFITTSVVYATPTDPEEQVDIPWEWIFPEAEQLKTVEPCESYPNCYDPPPFAPEPIEPEEKSK